MSKVHKKRITAACEAMGNLGITMDATKSALKYLVKLYDHNWKLIEDDNYMVLVDYLLDGSKNEDAGVSRSEDIQITELDYSQSSSGGSCVRDSAALDGSSIKLEEHISKKLPEHCDQEAGSWPLDTALNVSPFSGGEDESMMAHPLVNRQLPKESACQSKDARASRGEVLPLVELDHSRLSSGSSHLRVLEIAPLAAFDGSSMKLEDHTSKKPPEQEAGPPLDATLNVSPFSGGKDEHGTAHLLVNNRLPEELRQNKKNNAEIGKSTSHVDQHSPRRLRSKENHSKATADGSSHEFRKTPKRRCTKEAGPQIDCKGKIYLLSTVSDPAETVPALIDFRALKRVKCEKIIASEDGLPTTSLPDESHKCCQSQQSTSPLPSSNPSKIGMTTSPKEKLVPCIPGFVASTSSTSMNQHSKNLNAKEAARKSKTKGLTNYLSNGQASAKMTSVPQNQSASSTNTLQYISDITQGKEEVKIPLVGPNNEPLPNFHYIAQNIVSQDAFVSFALARISDDDCCFDCSGDCLSSSLPCHCARETGGEFAYLPGGLLRENFLDESISMNQNPQKCHFYYCKNCPLERSKKKKVPDPCKGHVVRKFVKECWSKCGCGLWCGNRVVQRGIAAKLQVFWTPGGKGWGLQTLEALPKGAFVCEYVGEIVTNTELHERNMQRRGKRHTYPVLLDADWGSEHVLKDEEALCLDATFYGNLGRFVNHRCFDSNLVEIPVEVETPDRHYYHLAFFTTRKVDPLEELTWDYGIDFSDKSHPVKAFKCLCASQFCREADSLT